MLLTCKVCGASVPVGHLELIYIKCNNGDCDFHLEYETYPHGELVQHWYLWESDDEEGT